MTGAIFDQLRAMQEGGGTNMSEALSLAYLEMQKAHNRDLLRDGVDNTLNTIVLFTDGVPSGLSVYPNDPANNALKPRGSAGSQSKCTYNPAGSSSSTQMLGWIAAPNSPPGPHNSYPGWGTSMGLFLTGAYDTSHTLSWWLGSSGAGDLSPSKPSSAVSGCYYLNNEGSGGGGGYYLKDLDIVPAFDIYGNSTTGLGYTNSQISDGTTTWYPNTGAADWDTPTTGYNVAAACWNATDAIGKRIRSQNSMNQIQIFTIGYTGNSPGTDVGLLKRLANTSDSTSYVATQPKGRFYQVNTTDQLSAAFDAVASSLLRLAQ